MRHLTGIAISLALSIIWTVSGYPQNISPGRDGNIRGVDARAMIVDKNTAYFATRSELFVTRENKEVWKSVFELGPGENEIQCILARGRTIFAGTKRGLFRTRDSGRTWQNIFRTIMPDKNNIKFIEICGVEDKRIIIGTMKGIFSSDDSGNTWKDIGSNLKNKPAYCAVVIGEEIYAGTGDGVYYNRMSSQGWERIYVMDAGIGGEDEEAPDALETEGSVDKTPCSLAASGDTVYCAAGRKIVYTRNRGKRWDNLTTSGLSGTINHLLCEKKADGFYCATTKGVFEFTKDKEIWRQLYKGIEKTTTARSLALDESDARAIWALTKSGIYRVEKGSYVEGNFFDVEKGMTTLASVFDGEPSFRQLRHAALEYAELDPEKIKRWRAQARLKALMPKVSLGVNNRRSTNSEIYTSASKDYVILGPDDVSKGVDVSVAWELGDLIWSDDQTNIDIRSRLTTQLRNDILDDLRRVYYERKRLQLEFMTSPQSDIRLLMERRMRLKELTQAIDDLTGNYLSDNMKTEEPQVD